MTNKKTTKKTCFRFDLHFIISCLTDKSLKLKPHTFPPMALKQKDIAAAKCTITNPKYSLFCSFSLIYKPWSWWRRGTHIIPVLYTFNVQTCRKHGNRLHNVLTLFKTRGLENTLLILLEFYQLFLLLTCQLKYLRQSTGKRISAYVQSPEHQWFKRRAHDANKKKTPQMHAHLFIDQHL